MGVQMSVQMLTRPRSLSSLRWWKWGKVTGAAGLVALAILFALGWLSLPLRARPPLKVAAMLAPVCLIGVPNTVNGPFQ